MNIQTNTSLFDWIREYWFLILFLGGMVTTWGSFSNRINNLEARQVSLEARQQQTDTGLNDVKGGIIRIETSLEFIKKQLETQ